MWICDMHRDYRLNIFFFFNDTATTEIYTLPLHDALPISALRSAHGHDPRGAERGPGHPHGVRHRRDDVDLQQQPARRSEEHTSELQSPCNLVCRLLLEKKKSHHYRSARTM